MTGRFRSAHVTHEDWRQAVDSCLRQLEPRPGDANLGFLYVTDLLVGHLEAILDRLRGHTGIADWVGTAGIGVAGNDGAGGCAEYFDRPAMAVMTAALPAESYRVFEPVHGGLGPFRTQYGGWLDAARPLVGLVHGDPRNPLAADIIAGMAEELGLYFVGGLTSSRTVHPQIADRIVEGGVSGVLFGGAVAVAAGLTQGCSPIGPVRTITDADENIIEAIDGRPALEAFKQDIGDVLARDLRRVGGYIYAALPVAGSDTGDYLVRNLTGIDPGKGWLEIGAQVETGDRIMFTRRDRDSAELDLKRMLGGLGRRAAGRPIQGGIYFSCVARGPNLFGDDSQELKCIRDSLGDFPLVGFFGNGEICNDRLYGYTGVLALFL
ncbi:MAG: FIST C-terminal domain-containing protein [Dongiaceae bacterium]